MFKNANIMCDIIFYNKKLDKINKLNHTESPEYLNMYENGYGKNIKLQMKHRMFILIIQLKKNNNT